jgi:hypothetical protein
MAFNETIYPVSAIDGFIDDKNGRWLILTSAGSFYGFSRDYEENTVIDGFMRGGLGSLKNIQNAIKIYAAENDKASSPRDQYIDKNGMPWIVSHEHNYLTADRWWGATQAYKGSMIYIEGSQGEFEFEIEAFAQRNKKAGTAEPPSPYTLDKPEPAPKDMNEARQRAYSLAVAEGLSPAEAQAVVSVGEFESKLGVAAPWLLSNGLPSYDVGALAGTSGAPNAFLGPLNRYWQRFSSMKEGVQALLRVPSFKASLPAWKIGDAVVASAIMFDGGYWEPQNCEREQCIMNYAYGVVAVDQNVASAIGQKPLLTAKSAVPAPAPGSKYADEGLGTGTTLLLAAGVGGILYWLFGPRSGRNS